MKIAYVSPFPPTRHGIGTYTRYLQRALSEIDPENEFLVAADSWARRNTTATLSVVPCFALAETLEEGQEAEYAEGVVRAVSDFAPAVVHVQHGASVFYPDDRFLGLLEGLRQQAKLIVTLHAVYTGLTTVWQGPANGFDEWNRRLGSVADAIVVHQPSMKEALIEQGVSARCVFVIPHGTEILRQVDSTEARRSLGLPEDGRIVLSFGFFKENKALLVAAFPYVLKEVSDAFLFFSGYAREWVPEDAEQRRDCEAKSVELGVRDHVIFATRFIPDTEVDVVFGAADVAVFPCFHEEPSASGSLHLALGAFKPVVVSRTPKFEEVWTEISDEVAFGANSPQELARVLVRVLRDDDFRQSIVARVERYALRTSWDVVAQEHLRLYDRLLLN